jgi:dipeptidyl aminopeptidase/acylaminoacyl peptidase
MRRPFIALSLLALVASSGAAQAPAAAPFDLSIRNIMRGPELYGREPEQVRWTADGQWIYFSWNEPGADWREPRKPYRVRARSGARPERVTQAHMDSVGPALLAGVPSPDRRYRAVAWQGDLYVVNVARGTTRRLTETTEAESSPTFGTTGSLLYFVRENNVYSIDLESGLTRQLTDVRSGPEPKDSAKAEGHRAFLEQQQRELLGAIRDRLTLDSIAKAEREAREKARVKPMYLMRGERVRDISVAPNGRALLIATVVPNERSLNVPVPNYVTSSGYTENLRSRDKVGDAQASGRIAFMSLPSGDVKFLRPTGGDTSVVASFVSLLGWNDGGTHGLVFVQSADFKTRWISTVSADAGTVRTIDTLRDTAWIAGPCFACGGWTARGNRAWFVSEADGYAHLYSVNADGGDRRQLTSGQWEVKAVTPSLDGRSFYISSNEGSPFETHLWRVPVSGGARTRITSGTGAHNVTLSPSEQWLATVYSEADKPWELYLMRNQPGAQMAQLTTSPSPEFLAYDWIKPEIVRIPASDGAQVPARIYRPADVGATANGAAVIFVHGAGYLQNVHNWWSSYAREYMFHHLLAKQGYTVLDLDYRASAGYGRDWRTAIYRHMGGRDLQDQVDASRWLRTELGIPPERVGIYGGSYGGFITLMALFTEGEHFGAGAGLRSVTDWAHYNHPYTGRILNLPQNDSLAYRRSSPIYFADGLNDPLLIAHGMVDVNVHFSDVVRLAQRLIELGKTDWEMAVYPVEDHGFIRPDSWTDEYRRIFELFEEHLHPGRPVQAQTTSGDGAR